MRKIFNFFKRNVRGLESRINAVYKVLSDSSYYKAESYYPESRKKKAYAIFFEQFFSALKSGYANEFYFLYGFDGKNREKKNDYITYSKFMELRNSQNVFLDNKMYNYIVLLRDKFVFGQYLKSLGFNSPENIAVINHGSVRLLKDNTYISIEDLLKMELDTFCKGVDGERGDTVFPLVIKCGQIFINKEPVTIQDFKDKLKGTMYIIQNRIKQHPSISRLYPLSINTIRLTTIYNRKTRTVDFFSATLRIGANNSYLDNWSLGGLMVNINEEGKLDKYGYFKPGYGGKVTAHPDTSILFEGYEIPFYDKCVNKAKELHSFLYGIHSIGWDIAIDEMGDPIFIEGNDNWAITLPQATIGGMKSRFSSTV